MTGLQAGAVLPAEGYREMAAGEPTDRRPQDGPL